MSIPLNKATAENLRRKSVLVDNVQVHKGIPLFSWVDLNLTELCNRQCVFCPRVDPSFYPNQNLQMAPSLVDKMAIELESLAFKGTIVFCGFGEPLLHPDVGLLASLFGSRGIRVEIVTNGDFLTPQLSRQLVDSGVKYFVVSMYDGPSQIFKFKSMFSEAAIDDSYYILRDRWYGPDQDFGLKLTNRAGSIDAGIQKTVDLQHPCFYLAYSLVVDWNGDVLLCVQDWHKRVKMGNINNNSMFEIWTGPQISKLRARLARGDRSSAPCNNCNAEGTLHGEHHVKEWGFRK